MEPVGELTLSEMNRIAQIRQQISQMTFEVGNLEVKKAALLTSIQQIESDASVLLQEAALRLGVDTSKPWSVTADGKIHIGA